MRLLLDIKKFSNALFACVLLYILPCFNLSIKSFISISINLTYGLEKIPTKEVLYKGHHFYEFDLDKALDRHPQLILVDELAHTNAPTSRHKKRYSDIEELLRAGIDVYTTVNVQHIESLHDVVESITKER